MTHSFGSQKRKAEGEDIDKMIQEVMEEHGMAWDDVNGGDLDRQRLKNRGKRRSSTCRRAASGKLWEKNLAGSDGRSRSHSQAGRHEQRLTARTADQMPVGGKGLPDGRLRPRRPVRRKTAIGVEVSKAVK